MALLTQAGYAKHRGISRQRVHQLVKSGRIELADGFIDVARADASLNRKPIRAAKTTKRSPQSQKAGKDASAPILKWFYECDRCSAEMPITPATPLPARIICPSCGADMTVVDLIELKRQSHDSR